MGKEGSDDEENEEGGLSPVPVDHFAHALRFEGPLQGEGGGNQPPLPRNLPEEGPRVCRWVSQVVELRVGEVDCELYYWPRDHLTPLIPDTVRAKREEKRKLRKGF